MEHLTTEKIKHFAAGKYPYEELLNISAHISNCQELCLQKLNEIAPDFLKEADALETVRERFIQSHDHFSKETISDYVGKKIKLDQRLAMNTYFTKCAVCAENLKKANPDYISDFIKDSLAGNRTQEQIADTETAGWSFNLLIPAGALIILLALMLGTVWFSLSHTNIDEAKLEPADQAISIANLENVHPNNGSDNDNVRDRVTSQSNNISGSSSRAEKPKISRENAKNSDDIKQNQAKPVNNSGNKLSGNKLTVTSRSLDKNCETLPDLAITPRNEVITDSQPVLKWKPMPDAVGYHVYLTDTKSNLIEESAIENMTENSYKLKNKLELNKKYEWKLIAKMKDGKEIFGETTQFSVGEKAAKLPEAKPKTKINDVRCLPSPKK